MRKVENGRSMVEMLGVLAIIGVLSVGGIAGYKMAMERHELNEMTNEINLAVNEAKAFIAMNPDKATSFALEKGKMKIGVNISATDCEPVVQGCGKYFLNIYGISKGVCQAIFNQKISFDYLNLTGWWFQNGGSPQRYIKGATPDGNCDYGDTWTGPVVQFIFSENIIH